MENNRKKLVWSHRGLMSLIDREYRSDVLGSYTGEPLDDEDDQPVQDADDL